MATAAMVMMPAAAIRRRHKAIMVSTRLMPDWDLFLAQIRVES
jgi:hypothetical protein